MLLLLFERSRGVGLVAGWGARRRMIRPAGERRRRLVGIGRAWRMARSFAASGHSVALVIGEGTRVVLGFAGASSNRFGRRPTMVGLVTRRWPITTCRRCLCSCKTAGAKNARRNSHLQSIHCVFPREVKACRHRLFDCVPVSCWCHRASFSFYFCVRHLSIYARRKSRSWQMQMSLFL
jgi:hypothetical protein